MGVYMHELPQASPTEIADKVWLYSLHKSIGMAALGLATLRILWAIAQPHPRPLHVGLEGFAAKTVHWLLYGSIIAMPILGWFHHAAAEGFAPIWWPFSQNLFFIPKDPNLSKIFGTAHFIFAILLVISLVLHISGAFKHLIIDRDKTLSRMIPGAYKFTGDIPKAQPKSHMPFYVSISAMAVAVIATFFVYTAKQQAGQIVAGNRDNISEQILSDGAWVIDKELSKLEIEISQLGSPVIGSFANWSANVIFDPDQLADSSINAIAQVGTLNLADVTDQALSDDFLSAAANPTATFSSENIIKADAGYEAIGQLTLAGMTQDFTISFLFEEREGRAFVKGEAIIQRLDFGVGKSYADDSSVGRAVKLLITIEAEHS